MKVIVSVKADADLSKMDASTRSFFLKHFKKLQTMPPRRHLRFGLPYNVENVTVQARFAYDIDGDTLLIVRCFATHKEYEKWYKTFK